MGKTSYKCSSCKKNFSRKSNAERHNIDIHNEMADIYNSENELISNRRAITTKNNESKQLSKGFNISALKAKYSNPSVDEDNNDEEKVLKVFGKMLPLIEVLDKSLTDIPHAQRIDTVAELIILSLSAKNPFKLMKNAIGFNHSIRGMKKASYFVAASKKITPSQAQEILRTTIFNAPYFKNKPFNNN